MTTRRDFLMQTSMMLDVAPLAACSSEREYESKANALRRHSAGSIPGQPALLRELARYATLAPSSHNTQCWKFRIQADAIAVLPDFSSRCPAVDPDDHHLFVSLGCAVENLAQAARANGLNAEAKVDAANEAMNVTLAPTQPVASTLFKRSRSANRRAPSTTASRLPRRKSQASNGQAKGTACKAA